MSESSGAASAVVSVATNADGWFTSVSPGFLALIAQPVEALAGVNVVDLVHPLDAAGARGLMSAASVNPQATVRLLTAGDQWSPMEVRTSVLPEGRIKFDMVAHVAVATAPPATAAAATPPAAVSPVSPEPGAELPSAAIASSQDQIGAVSPVSPASPEPGAELPPAGFAEDMPATSPRSLVGDFPYADSEEHMDYVASRPSLDVATERAAIRQAATDAGAIAMIEVDTGGRTVFVTGEWPVLAGEQDDDANPVPVTLERLLTSTNQGQHVFGLVHRAIQPGESGDAIVEFDGGDLRHVRVEPLPSPLRAGVMHSLVAVAPAPPGATVSTVGDPAWSAAVAAPASDAAPIDPTDPSAFEEAEANVQPDGDAEAAGESEADGDLDADEADADEVAAGSVEGTKSKRWIWIALAAVALLALWALFGRSADETSDMGPVDIQVVASDPIEIDPGQTWRALGVGGLSDIHGIAAIDGGALVASTSGRIVQLDDRGLAMSMVVVGDPALSAISDLTATGDGTSWALDAGMAQIYRIAGDGQVTILDVNPDPLRNSRGIALGRDNNLWVASTASSQLLQIGRDGGIISTILQPGRQPSDVVELDDGTLWYVDAELLELVHVSPAGETLSTLPIESFFSNEGPHLAVVGDTMWVTEPVQGSVFAVDLATDEPTGERINLARAEGARVERPIGLTAAADGHLWTVDSLGRATIILDP